MQKPVIIILGGEPRNIPDELHEIFTVKQLETGEMRISNAYAPAALAMVGLRWMSRQLWDGAKVLAAKRKIPIRRVPTGNYIIPELEKIPRTREIIEHFNRQKKEREAEAPTREEAPQEPDADAEPMAKIGVTIDELIVQYKTACVETLQSVMQPGEKVHQKSLFPIIADLMGLPEDDVAAIMDKMESEGYVTRIGDSTWKYIHGDDAAIMSTLDDDEEVPDPDNVMGGVMAGLVKLMRGLPPGPYKSKWALGGEVTHYKEFTTKIDGKGGKAGKRVSQSYGALLVSKAIERGVVEVKPGGVFVNHDPDVKLTYDPVKKPKKAGKEAKKKSVTTTKSVPLSEIDTVVARPKASGPKKPAAPPKRSEDPKHDIGEIGYIDLFPGTVKRLKSLIPSKHWDECAKKAIMDRQKANGLQFTPVGKDQFDSEEWDALAWEKLSKLPMGAIAPVMKEVYEDERCICMACGSNFVFSKGEKEYFFDTFGEIKTPSRCRPCRKSGRYSDDGQDRVLSRHGG